MDINEENQNHHQYCQCNNITNILLLVSGKLEKKLP